MISLLVLFYRYDWSCMEREMTTRDVLKEKVGVCRQYVQIFSEMCQLANIKVKSLRGFAKGHTYIPGMASKLFSVEQFVRSKENEA